MDCEIKVCWTGGAGILVSCKGKVLGIDLYFSNSCMTTEGMYKRMIPPPWPINETEFDYLICSHEHGDHADTGSMPEWFSKKERILLGPDSVMSLSEGLVSQEQCIAFNRGDQQELGPFTVKAVYCDHGKQSPDAVGFLVTVGGKSIYYTGDMTYRPDLTAVTGIQSVDVLIIPINGLFGNPTPAQAADMTAMLSPKVVIPCHYWLFVEHGGDPATFIKECNERAPETLCRTTAVGEWLTICKLRAE